MSSAERQTLLSSWNGESSSSSSSSSSSNNRDGTAVAHARLKFSAFFSLGAAKMHFLWGVAGNYQIVELMTGLIYDGYSLNLADRLNDHYNANMSDRDTNDLYTRAAKMDDNSSYNITIEKIYKCSTPDLKDVCLAYERAAIKRDYGHTQLFDASSNIPASAVGYNKNTGGEGGAYGTAEERMKAKSGKTAEGKVKYITGPQIR